MVDFVEFAYIANAQSTFDVTQVNCFSLPLTLTCKKITSGPEQVGVNTGLSNFSRAQIGTGYLAFLKNEPSYLQEGPGFDRLLYNAAVGKIFVEPPQLPNSTFFALVSPNQWLANQLTSTANTDAMVTWWDDTIDAFFAKGNYLQVATNATDNYTGVYDDKNQCFDFYSGLNTSGTVLFKISKPSPTASNPNGQSLANALWVWGQSIGLSEDGGLAWDQIVEAFCRGVALDGILTTVPTVTGASNTAWTNTSNWYTVHGKNKDTRYCPYAKFLHYCTLDGGIDTTGTSSIYLSNLAYGFSMDETPPDASGNAISTGVPSKMDGTVPDGATLTITIGAFG